MLFNIISLIFQSIYSRLYKTYRNTSNIKEVPFFEKNLSYKKILNINIA